MKKLDCLPSTEFLKSLLTHNSRQYLYIIRDISSLNCLTSISDNLDRVGDYPNLPEDKEGTLPVHPGHPPAFSHSRLHDARCSCHLWVGFPLEQVRLHAVLHSVRGRWHPLQLHSVNRQHACLQDRRAVARYTGQDWSTHSGRITRSKWPRCVCLDVVHYDKLPPVNHPVRGS